MLSRRQLSHVALLLTVCLLYSNFFANSFHFDDFHTVTDNPAVRSLSHLPRIFTDATAFSVLPANQTYRPLVTSSLALDYALGHGYVPFWFHLSTLIWFLVLVAVLARLFELLFDRIQPSSANRWLALGGAAWFGLHPAMAETVNYIIQRGDLYCTLGCVAGMFVFAHWPGLRRCGIYLLPFIAAMLSKPPAAVFPALLLLYVFFFESSTFPPGKRWRASAVAAFPALLMTALLLILQSRMTPKSYTPTILSAADYRLTQPFVWFHYVSALFLPLHLNVDTDLQPFATLNGRAVAGLVFLLGLLVLIAYAGRRRRLYPIAFGLLWFVLTQLPTSLYPLSEVENDHRMFFSFPGLMLATVWALHIGYERVTGWLCVREVRASSLGIASASLIVLCLCGYAYGAHRRNEVWRSEDTLWADDVAKSPRNGRGLMNYGLTRMNVGDYGSALSLFNRALGYLPNYPSLEINLGVVTSEIAAQGNPAMNAVAEQHFQRALSLAPNDDITHSFYGRWLIAQGHVPEAVRELQTAVALNPNRPMQRDLLLTAYRASGDVAASQRLATETLAMIPDDTLALAVVKGDSAALPSSAATLIKASLTAFREARFQQSIDIAKQALAVDPRSAEAWNNVGAGYGALHQWDLGIAAEQQALGLNPKLQIAQNNLRWFQSEKQGSGSRTVADYLNASLTLNQQGRYEESITAAKQAISLDSHSAEAWNNIAADNAALRRWDDSIAAAKKAVALKPDLQLAKNNLAWALQEKAGAKQP